MRATGNAEVRDTECAEMKDRAAEIKVNERWGA